MQFGKIFGELPYGFSDFNKISGSLINCAAKKRLPENSETVISILFPYFLGEEYYVNSNISRYAVSADYHIITKKLLDSFSQQLKDAYPGYEFAGFIDNSPIPEVRCACAAGLGAMGRNGLFISPDYGSWVFIGEIVTDMEIPFSDKPLALCDGCERCIKACPGNALTGNGIITEKCLSYLSQKKGGLDEDIQKKMVENNCAWGCDTCQTVCPLNKGSKITPIREFFDTANPVVTADDSIEGRAFAWRGKDVIARNLKAFENKKSKRSL